MADTVANMSVAARGQLVYVADEPRANQPRWYSRDGTLIGPVGDLGEYTAARVSPSGTLLATVRADPVDVGRSVWVLDLARNVDRQISVDGNMDDPVWSPDSERIAFAWMRPGEEMSNVHDVRPDEPGTVWHFDPGADGTRFLVLSLNEAAEATPVHFVAGWQ